MEDVLDLYAQPPDARRPTVCFDERPVQLVAHARTPIPPGPGRPARVDYEYVRRGTCNLFTFFAPHLGWRHVEVTDRRTKVDFARMMKALVDTYFPYATTIRVVLDNLNTHALASLYEAFPAAEARRIAKKVVFHYTPNDGSWLNMAEPRPN
jgi:DDE superfamily endonuclease